jgi:hypothetical protein
MQDDRPCRPLCVIDADRLMRRQVNVLYGSDFKRRATAFRTSPLLTLQPTHNCGVALRHRDRQPATPRTGAAGEER